MPIISLAQSKSKILPKTDAFLIKSDGTIKNKILESLVNYGFSILEVDENIIRTEVKGIKSWGYDINVSIIDSNYYFRIYYRTFASLSLGGALTTPVRDKCTYRSFKSGAFKIGINTLYEIVTSLDTPFECIISHEGLLEQIDDSDSEENSNYDDW